MPNARLIASVALVCALVVFALHPAPGTDLVRMRVTTYHNNLSRQGVNSDEVHLTPTNVSSAQFGKLFAHRVDGAIYGQPLYLTDVYFPSRGVRNVVFVATEHDSVYAFDADRGDVADGSSLLWKRSFINLRAGVTTVSADDVSCGDIVPEVGITGTPVIDTASNTLYLVAKTKERGRAVQRLHALDVPTGKEKFGGPVEIAAQVSGTGIASAAHVVKFDPLRAHQRAGLTMQNGLVYIAWASHCDTPPYHGWVMAYDLHTLRRVGLWNSTPDGQMGGIWQSGAAPAGDGERLFLSTGNGDFDAARGGRSFGDSIVQLGAPRAGVLPLLDYFTPYDEASLNAGDIEPGSGGTILISAVDRPAHLLVNVSKSGTVYVLDPARMGRFHPQDNSNIVQSLPSVTGGVWGTPAWWGGRLYVAASYDRLKAFTFDWNAGRFSPSPDMQSDVGFTYPGPTPAVSSNGKKNGIVWLLQTEAYVDGGSAVLRAFDAQDLARELYNSAERGNRDDAGPAVKFSVPTVINGKVYVGAQDRLTVYGLLH
jgi:hypothetical protein